MTRTLIMLAAGLGLLAVLAGTFAAHGLKGRLEPDMLAIWETAARYHMYHALVLLGLAGVADRLATKPVKLAAVFLTLGILIFSSSLYALALTGEKWLGMITPVGGLCFMGGWIAIFFAALRSKR